MPGRAPERLPLTAADNKRLTTLLDEHAPELPKAQRAPQAQPDAASQPQAQLAATHQHEPAPAADGGGIPSKSLPLRAAGREEPSSDASAPLLAAAEAARRAGRIEEARAAYQAASRGRSDSAEIALLRWVRFELDAGTPQAAQRVLALHRRRFARGHLGAEASWQEIVVWQALGRTDRARQAAKELLAHYADTPQAEGARRVLDAP
jgi:hypothetical protein